MADTMSLPMPPTMMLPLEHLYVVPEPVAPSISNITPVKETPIKEEFSPSKHLVVEEPEVIMMKDIGFSNDTGVSPVALSKPFQLFSPEAVQQMREEIFDVRDNHPEYLRTSSIATSQLRGYCPKYAPFTYDAWTHPDTLAAISKIAGIDLIPWANYEIAHINFAVKSASQIRDELAEVESSKRAHDEDEGIGGCPHEDDKPIVGWHRDSYPFVCVLMLSDCTNMIGGETAILKGDGEIAKIRGPAMGCAAILQGRYITHQALRALGAAERITAVTSFRPKSSFVRDDSVLNTVRPISDLSELYYDFAEYRMDMLVDRFQAKLREFRAAHTAGKRTHVKLLKEFLAEQQRFLEHTCNEMVPYEDVIEGLHFQDLPDVLAHLQGGIPTPPEIEIDVEASTKRLRSE